MTMYGAGSNPYQQYKQQSIMTMTQGEMLTQLYDGIIKQLTAATLCIESKDLLGANQTLQKAQVILNYLRQTLDRQFKVSEGLDSLYEYFIHRVIQANVRKSVEPIEEILPMIIELKETFVTADRAARAK